MSNISLTIPTDDKRALVAGATMLLTLAGKVPAIELDDQPDNNPNGLTAEEIAPVIPPVPAPTVDAAAAFGGAPTIPAPSTPAETITTVSDQIDTDGLPWDARIHAGTKTRNADGRWKRRKGVDDADYQRIVDELRTLMAAPVQAAAVTPPPVQAAATPATDAAPATAPTVPVPAVPTPPAAPVQTVTPPPAAPADGMTFGEFLKAVMGRIQAKTITMQQVNEIAGRHGVANLQLVGARLDLIPQLWADIEAVK